MPEPNESGGPEVLKPAALTGRYGYYSFAVPEMEHQESINKTRAVLRAIERAREM